MLQLIFRPELHRFETVRQFAEEFSLGETDLVITNQYIYEPYFGGLGLTCKVLYQERYGSGSPPTRWWKRWPQMYSPCPAHTSE